MGMYSFGLVETNMYADAERIAAKVKFISVISVRFDKVVMFTVCVFAGCVFAGCVFAGCVFAGCVFAGCVFAGCDFGTIWHRNFILACR